MRKAILLLITSFAAAADYQTDPLSIHSETVSVISSFEEKDFFTVYSSEGKPLWEVSFASKIISSKIDRDHLYIFSKARANQLYFLSCFDAGNGELKWERPIFGPEAAPDPMP
jgi:hypothetical protein